jgi:uncharacterized membrane protein YccF (DUF307 family)
VRLLLNLIWLIFGGLVMAFGYAVVALVMFVLIITIPFGIASARMAFFACGPSGVRWSGARMRVRPRLSET